MAFILCKDRRGEGPVDERFVKQFIIERPTQYLRINYPLGKMAEITGKTRVLYSELGEITGNARVLPCEYTEYWLWSTCLQCQERSGTFIRWMIRQHYISCT